MNLVSKLCSVSITAVDPLNLSIRKKGKDQESILSSTTPATGHRKRGTKHKKTSHTREPRGQSFPIV